MKSSPKYWRMGRSSSRSFKACSWKTSWCACAPPTRWKRSALGGLNGCSLTRRCCSTRSPHKASKKCAGTLPSLIPRLRLDARERRFAVALLFDYLEDDSKIVKTNAMQALAELAAGDASLRQKVIPVLEQLTATGSPAMRARGRKLLADTQRAGLIEKSCKFDIQLKAGLS